MSAVPSSDSPVLKEIVRRLVEVYEPERIYLFGSVARGEATPDSDYDLMIVVPDDTPDEKRHPGRAYPALFGVGSYGEPSATDVVVFTRSYFDDRLPFRASLPSTVVREGRLLYAA